MQFNYKLFLDSLRKDSCKKECIERYERHIEPIGQKSLRKEKWYIELVKSFPYVSNILYPSILRDQYDWNLLIQLGASSLSSELGFERVDNNVHLIIKVVSGDNTVVKTLNDLWGFQITRLFEIYIEEQINLCALCYEDANERIAIYSSKQFMLEKWNHRISDLEERIQRA